MDKEIRAPLEIGQYLSNTFANQRCVHPGWSLTVEVSGTLISQPVVKIRAFKTALWSLLVSSTGEQNEAALDGRRLRIGMQGLTDISVS